MATSPSTLLLAGATGPTGAAMVRRLVGHPHFPRSIILAHTPVRRMLRAVTIHVVEPVVAASWPRIGAEVAVVMFDPPRLFHEREKALWTPTPDDLPALCHWLRACGVRTVALVQPHDAARLPAALQHGFANIDEQAIAALGFERLLILRSPRDRVDPRATHPLQRVAQALLGALRHLIPAQDRPVRPATVAEFVLAALQLAPAGVHVLSTSLLHAAAQGSAQAVLWNHFRRDPGP